MPFNLPIGLTSRVVVSPTRTASFFLLATFFGVVPLARGFEFADCTEFFLAAAVEGDGGVGFDVVAGVWTKGGGGRFIFGVCAKGFAIEALAMADALDQDCLATQEM